MTGVILRVYGVPKPQGSKVAYRVGAYVKVTEYDATRMKALWRNDVSTMAHRAITTGEVEPYHDGVPLAVHLTFWLPKPAYRPKIKLSWPTVAPDLDKLARSTLDACTAVGLWHDDAQVVELTLSKAYVGAEHPEPGALIVIDAVAAYVDQQALAL